jgi:hypothetical protein
VFERTLRHLALHNPARSMGRKILFKVQQTSPQIWGTA